MSSGSGVTLVEEAFVCRAGGGFEEVRWQPWVNDDYMRLDLLVRRGPTGVGGVVAQRIGAEDPNGVIGADWASPSAGCWFRHEIHVTAPDGTLFWRRHWIPNRERARLEPFLRGVPYDKYDRIYELRGEGRLVAVRGVASPERTVWSSGAPEKPVTPEEARRKADAIVEALLALEAPSRKAG